jgi:rhomboid protease GluP
MNDPGDNREIVFRTPQRQACMESRLVLESTGIATDVVHQDGEWLLLADPSHFAAAMAELEAYRLDNENVSKSVTARVPTFQWAFIGVLGYAAVIVVIAIFSGSPESRPRWISLGRMQAGDVMAGQYWRTVTALTLHNDVGHLLSNLAYGSVFGLLAGRILGGGVAWLTIVIAGSLGNFLNALMRDADHSSIGASTAVFAALGVMVAHALQPRTSMHEKVLKRWSPLICGVVLLAFTGVGGENTDVGAHVAGFLGGLLIGWFASRMPDRYLASGRVQSVAGITAVGIVVAAWIAAIASV